MSALKRLFYIIALAIGGGLVANLLSGIVFGVMAVADGDFNPLQSRSTILILQVISQILMFFVPAYIYFKTQKKKIMPSLELNHKAPLSLIVPVIGVLLLSMPVIDFLGGINQQFKLPQSMADLESMLKAMEEGAMQMTETIMNTTTIIGLFNNIVVMAVFAAVGEEVIFRGIIQKTFNELFKNIHLAVIVTAILFSFVHFQFYGFLPRLFLGLILGYIYVYTRNLWMPIMIHFFNNAFAVVAYFLWKKGVINVNPLTDYSFKPEYITVIFALLAIVVVMDYIRKKNRTKTEES